MFPLKKPRNSYFGPSEMTPQTPQSNNPLLADFMRSVIPMLQQRERMNFVNQNKRIREQRGYETRESDKNRLFQETLQRPRFEQIATPRPIVQDEEPMNTYFRPYSDFSTRADLQDARLQSNEKMLRERLGLEAEKLDESQRKNKVTEETNKRKVEETERSNKQKGDIANKRVAVSQLRVDKEMPEKDKIELQARLQRELQEIKGDQSLEAENLRGDIRMKIQELQGKQATELETQRQEGRVKLTVMRGNLPSQQKFAFENKINYLRLTKPELAKFLEIDPNTGDITVSDDITEAQRKELIKTIGESPKELTGVNTGFDNVNTYSGPDIVLMEVTNPDGTKKRIKVPKDKVTEAEKRGAKRVN